jgi:hypothetical protein
MSHRKRLTDEMEVDMSKDDCLENRKDINIFQGVPPAAGSLLIALIANALADEHTIEEITVMAGFFTSLGDLLGYIAAQKDLNKPGGQQTKALSAV